MRDIELLGRLGKLAGLANAPFLAAAAPGFVGCDSFAAHPDPRDWTTTSGADSEEAWGALRALPEAGYLGLALPRFLLRQPYGKTGEPIERFPFEELPVEMPHESYLWGNPAVICGALLAQAFRADGWAMQASGYGEFEDLPVHSFKADGETGVTPCAEAWLSDRAGERILEQGLMPVLSVRGRPAVRVVSIQSVRKGAAALAGRWG